MTTSFDRSHKDKKYFIDGSIYNCPFCNRRNVRYNVKSKGAFNVSNQKWVYFYLIRCADNDCGKISFHLSNYDLDVDYRGDYDQRFTYPPQQRIRTNPNSSQTSLSDIPTKNGKAWELDDLFFYHQPSAYFTIDERVPKTIREPLSEAQDCLKSNFLTGASGCLRKSTYKLLKEQDIPETNKRGKFLKHEERVNLLKKKHTKIEGVLFDKLKAIHMLTSQELHENDWQDFESNTLRFLLEIVKEILSEIYIIPDEKIRREKELTELEVSAKNKTRNISNNEKK